MSLPSSLVIDQLRLVRGVPQDETPTVSVYKPRSFLRRHDPGLLFALIDLLNNSPGDDALLNRLMEMICRTYEQESGSVTRRLRRAITAANRYLHDQNRRRKNGRQAAGLTCAALVDDVVYLAQAGPALAFVAQPGVIEQHPMDSPWLSEEPLESMPGGIWAPLGVRDEVYVDLNITQIGPGYTLFLVSAHLPQFLTLDDVDLLLDQNPEGILQDLTAMASGQNLSALVAGFLEAEPAEPDPEPDKPGLGEQTARVAHRAMVAMGTAGAAMLKGIANILEALLPERIDGENRTSSTRRQQVLMWLAIILPFALALLTIATYWGLRSNREIQFPDLVQSASERLEQARALAETDPNRARELLLAASRELDQALSLQSDDMAEQLRADVQSQLERIERITRLSDIISVASLPGTADDRRRLIVQGTSAFVLNRQAQVAYRVGLGDRRIVELLKSDETLAERLVGPLIDMAWVPAGGVRSRGAIVVLDSSGTVWQIDVTGEVVPLRIANAEAWRDPRLAGGFAGNFYILDVGLGQIFKYPPTVDGYATPPVKWLSVEADVDLKNVVDMAIDGSIYLLQSDSHMEKLVAGQPAPFDQPDEFDLGQPIACFARPSINAVFLADTAHVLQFDNAGVFQRQLLPPEGQWKRLSALWVDERNGRLYAVDDGTLIMATLPSQ